jgi:hypothetical protein
MASVAPPQPSYRPKLPQRVISQCLLSAPQLETVIYAGNAHQSFLPAHYQVDETLDEVKRVSPETEGAVQFRRGYFLGDGTGVGKGRQVAAILLDNWLQGRHQAVWISKSDKLLEDARRDWQSLGGDESQIVPLSKFKQGEPIRLGDAILFTTYATLRSEAKQGKCSRVEQIVRWLGAEFEGAIIFDESHAMGNAAAEKGQRGVKKASQQGVAGLRLQRALPRARVVYASATGATQLANLAYAERLGLWGTDEFPFTSRENFISQVALGEVAALEVVARDLKALGLYCARSLSFEGNKQRFFNHLLVSMKCPTLLKAIACDLEAGHSAVVQLVSTDEALLSRRLAQIPVSEWGDIQVDVTPREYVLDYLKSAFPVQLQEVYTDEEGEERSRPVTDSESNPVLCREALALRDALMESLALLPPVPSALDQLVQHFGDQQVAEVSGRSRRLVREVTETSDKLRVQKRSATANLAETQAFMSGRKRILAFTGAGNTGRSYHADLDAPNRQLRRHYLVESGWRADEAIQGLGRSHRSHQQQPPNFLCLTTNVKGEKRFTSTIARRLDSLGALTKRQRQTGSQGLFRAEDNLESPYAKAALRQLYESLYQGGLPCCSLTRFQQLTGLTLEAKEGGLKQELPPISQFLNRVLALPIAEQNALFEELEVRLAANVEAARAAGVYEVGVETLRAEGFKVLERHPLSEHPSGATTYAVTIERRQKNPIRSALEALQIAQVHHGQLVVNQRSGRAAVAVPTTSLILDSGGIVPRLNLIRPLGNDKIADWEFAKSHWQEVPPEAFLQHWEAEAATIPEYATDQFALVTGLLLPVWDRLDPLRMKVWRLQTDDGERLLGRMVDADWCQENAASQPQTPDEIFAAVWEQGQTVKLTQRLSLKQSLVAGQRRLEIVGFQGQQEYDWLKSHGAFGELLNYQLRAFLPATAAAVTAIERLRGGE